MSVPDKPLWIYRANTEVLLDTNIPLNNENTTAIKSCSFITVQSPTTTLQQPKFDETGEVIPSISHNQSFLQNHIRSNLIIIADNRTLQYAIDDDNRPSKAQISNFIFGIKNTPPVILHFLTELDQTFLNAGVDSFNRDYLKAKNYFSKGNHLRTIIINKLNDNNYTLRIITDTESILTYGNNIGVKSDTTKSVIADKQTPIMTSDVTFKITANSSHEATVSCTDNFILGYRKELIEKLPELLPKDLIPFKTKDNITAYDASYRKPPSLFKTIAETVKKNPGKTALLTIAAVLAPPIAIFALIVSATVLVTLKLQEWWDENKVVPANEYKFPPIVNLTETQPLDSNTSLQPKTTSSEHNVITTNNQDKKIVSFPHTPAQTTNKSTMAKLKSFFSRQQKPWSTDQNLNTLLQALSQAITSFTLANFIKSITNLINYTASNAEINLADALKLLRKNTQRKLLKLIYSANMHNIIQSLENIQLRTSFNSDEPDEGKLLELKQAQAKSILTKVNQLKQAVTSLPEYKKPASSKASKNNGKCLPIVDNYLDTLVKQSKEKSKDETVNSLPKNLVCT